MSPMDHEDLYEFIDETDDSAWDRLEDLLHDEDGEPIPLDVIIGGAAR